jgi:uncharacterized protein YecE (DUF72 family)
VIQVGIAGWSYPDWEGPVYPRAKPRGFHPLDFLAPFVDALEVNSSFYAVPARRNVERWAAIAARHSHLTFTAKLHQDLTHEGWTSGRRGRWREQREAFEPLVCAGRMLAWLAQFPSSFRDRPASRAHLEALRAALEPAPWVVEVRHRSWYEPDAHGFLRGLGCSLAAIDLPPAADHPPEDAPPVGPLGYLRLHGRNAAAWLDARAGRDQKYDHRYASAEIAGLVERARRIAATRERTLVIANNHFGGKALAASLELSARIRGAPVPAPATVVEAFPDLKPWVRVREEPGRQRALFEDA